MLRVDTFTFTLTFSIAYLSTCAESPLAGQPATESIEVHRAWEILECSTTPGSTLVDNATHVVANVLMCNTLAPEKKLDDKPVTVP